ncbi:DUF397 domain-containing protein [Streptomyces griseoviridis]|uniref:DUF397 domain-containing protein n=1 Tax=Streptomyces griseoviridis TaxID=45398 RepID=A0ABT9LM97_STRGD|nr:DUF397 domain-containing protein [Streptomyces griseoviridis]MDP9684634.1 hypothetical protein [Streptomyces griseoviridis]GGT21028.1 toxin [Streptomyces griseoviridis]
MSTFEPAWFKSSYSGDSGDNCVEVAVCPEIDSHAWTKSSYSGSSGDNCVEVSSRPGVVLVRDSKDTARQPLAVSPGAWTAFTEMAAR